MTTLCESEPVYVVDDVVFVGSPGVGADGVDGVHDLSIDPEHVWATKLENDAISLSPNIGEDFLSGVGTAPIRRIPTGD